MAVASDNPIRSADEDALGRAAVAASFVRQVLTIDASAGMVVGVLGSWGSGKTSFVNLARDDLAAADVPVLDFNPWMFSGAEQLVDSFFIELAAQLKLRPDLAQVGRDFSDYGEAFSGLTWLPVVGPWIDRGRGATKLLSRLLQRRQEGVGGRRAKIDEALSDLAKPILVVLDDIDRLSTTEIRDVFKLVRLTASFPNIVYVLAFDRHRVEQALTEQGIPGRDYLEKILQVVIDLPAVPQETLGRQVLEAIDSALAGIESPGPFDTEAWPDVFAEVIRPLVRTMRDVKRYAGAVHGTADGLGGQVALVDLLALEALRVFLPDAFAQLGRSIQGLTTTRDFGYGEHESPHLKAQIDKLIDSAGDRGDVVRALIARRFPAAGRHIGETSYGSAFLNGWLRDRRVAHEEILRLYLERIAGAKLQAFDQAERAWHVMDDAAAFEARLQATALDEREDVIQALEAYEDQFRPEHVVPATTVLLNQLPVLPARPRSMMMIDTRMVVGRVTYRLIRSLKDPVRIETAVRAILPEVTTLSSKFELISDVGYRDGAGHKLVTQLAAAKLEAEWQAEVFAAAVADLVVEPDLLRVLVFARSQIATEHDLPDVPADPTLTLALLRSAQTEALSQTMGSRAVRRDARLHWETLIAVYGDETKLIARIDEMKAAGVAADDDADLIEMATKYSSGWRPSEFGRNDG